MPKHKNSLNFLKNRSNWTNDISNESEKRYLQEYNKSFYLYAEKLQFLEMLEGAHKTSPTHLMTATKLTIYMLCVDN